LNELFVFIFHVLSNLDVLYVHNFEQFVQNDGHSNKSNN